MCKWLGTVLIKIPGCPWWPINIPNHNNMESRRILMALIYNKSQSDRYIQHMPNHRRRRAGDPLNHRCCGSLFPSTTPDRNLLDVLDMDSYCAMAGNKFVSIGYSIDLNCSRFTYQYIFSGGGDDDHDNAQLCRLPNYALILSAREIHSNHESATIQSIGHCGPSSHFLRAQLSCALYYYRSHIGTQAHA